MADEYENLGSVVQRQAEVQKKAAQRKLDQQFTGRLSSGAAAKIGAKAMNEIDMGTQDQLAKLQYEKAAKGREERLIKEGQTFQTSERLGQQAFAGDEAQRNRGFSREERLGTQDFQAAQSSLDRILQQANVNLGYEQLREQQRQFGAEFEENVRTSLFNKIVALKDIDSGKLTSILNMLTKGDTGRSNEIRQIITGTTNIPNPTVNAPFNIGHYGNVLHSGL
jgi:hypothetical protein